MIALHELFKIPHTSPRLICFFVLMLGTGYAHAADPGKGSELYATHCASCHGTSGVSVMIGAPNFSRSESLLRPDASLLTAIKNGKNAMPGYQGILTDHDILDVIAFLRTLY